MFFSLFLVFFFFFFFFFFFSFFFFFFFLSFLILFVKVFVDPEMCPFRLIPPFLKRRADSLEFFFPILHQIPQRAVCENDFLGVPYLAPQPFFFPTNPLFFVFLLGGGFFYLP